MPKYYGELCTKMYEVDKSLAEGIELDFYLSYVTEGVNVLEPMCGNGRMLIPFMQRGINIEGFDISEEMLITCENKCRQMGLAPNVRRESIDRFKASNKYDLIMIPFGSFSLLPDELVGVSLQNMKDVLKADGKLLLTIMIRHQVEILEDWVETRRHLFGSELIVEYKKNEYHAEKSLLTTKLQYQLLVDGEIQKTEFMDLSVRLYDSLEFVTILKTSGFQDVKIHEVKDGYGEGYSFYVYECSGLQ
ncbi:class I SAM-dependent methyltransferase [Paenibacillus sp. TRM 82003]|nr:class I SAM-dependent methyltransferase [Paenibacillus sp. TRM 82003]